MLTWTYTYVFAHWRTCPELPGNAFDQALNAELSICQGEELEPARAKAKAAGIKEIFIDDLKEEFVRDYVFPMFRCGTASSRFFHHVLKARAALILLQCCGVDSDHATCPVGCSSELVQDHF